MTRYILLFAILLSSCASPQKQKGMLPRPDRLYSKHELLSIIESRNRAVSTIEGKLSSVVISGGEKRKTTELMLIKKPSHMRVDILSPFGSPVLTMATNGEDVDLQYHSKGRFFKGRADDPDMAGILSSSLDLKELILLLTGGLPLINYDESKSMATWDGRGFKLSLKNESARQDILFDAEGLYPLEAAIFDGQETTLLSVTMDRYEERGGFNFPSSIALSMPLEAYEMKVKYSSVSLNENLGPEPFKLYPPDGVPVEAFDGLKF